ncbi:RagB/SusD family nutrient uptake outer membrane protein [Pedobacter sp.]|uniref:RagB/SusD family nutrient uptake outer membrane protein n=1 Tax=Pedobacter sp. TaxID=1411316 RepID=UPI003D7FDAD1
MKNIKIYSFIGVMALCTMNACKKDLDTTNPNVVPTDSYFKTATELVAGTNSIYAAWHGTGLVAREWYFLHDLRSDDVVTGGSQLESPRNQILIGVVDPANPVMNSVWNTLYTVIHRANTVLDNAPLVTDNTAIRDRSAGEAKFLRAWAYFDLVSMWGSVPLYSTAVKSPNDYQPKAKAEDIYAMIIKDLQEAATVLPGKSGTDLGRVTNAAANAMLGRVMMQKGDYEGAKAALLKIPTSGTNGYSLTSRFLDNFEEETEFNNESIFEIIFSDKGDNNFNWGSPSGDGVSAPQSTIRNQEYNPIGWRNLIPSNKMLNEFENTATGATKTDPRFAFSFYQTGDVFNNGASTLVDADQNGNSSVVNGRTLKIGFRKYMLIYKQDRAFAAYHPGSNNQRIIRYAEVLLMLAECENELGNTPAAVAYLNQIRARPSVAMPPYPTNQFPVSNKADVIKALMHEKIAEMTSEHIRNIDILRWRAKGYFAVEPLSWHTADKLFLPTPQSEIDNNPNL